MADTGETMADYWKDVRPHLRDESKRRRQDNRLQARHLLESLEVTFVAKNAGAHLVVTRDGKVVDFWPGTGLYQPRGTTKRGRGVFNLLRYLGITPPPRATNCKTPQGGA